MLVWQEFPLRRRAWTTGRPKMSAASPRWPRSPSSYIERRHITSRCCSGAAATSLRAGWTAAKTGVGKPVDASHPLIAKLAQVVAETGSGPALPAHSSSGPRFRRRAADFGKGLHWDVHGPWKLPGTMAGEMGRVLGRRRRALPLGDGRARRQLRRDHPPLQGRPGRDARHGRQSALAAHQLVDRVADLRSGAGREPASLEEFVGVEPGAPGRGAGHRGAGLQGPLPALRRFIIWMGHDSFPCTANTAIVDFDGNPKPAALALREVFSRSDVQTL